MCSFVQGAWREKCNDFSVLKKINRLLMVHVSAIAASGFLSRRAKGYGEDWDV